MSGHSSPPHSRIRSSSWMARRHCGGCARAYAASSALQQTLRARRIVWEFGGRRVVAGLFLVWGTMHTMAGGCELAEWDWLNGNGLMVGRYVTRVGLRDVLLLLLRGLSVDYSNVAATMPKGTVPARKVQFFFCAASAQRSFCPLALSRNAVRRQLSG
eukprot:353470-Chlamydomonas_euryale.AAC.6